MIAARTRFFDAGHYQPLADAIAELIVGHLPGDAVAPVVVDAGCGEGYYLRRLRRRLAGAASPAAVLAGLDVSKHGIRVASKRDRQGSYAVAGSYRMPVREAAVNVLLTQFSPVSAVDFRRVVLPGGAVLVGGPGAGHLFSLKELLYRTPSGHDPAPAPALGRESGFEPLAVHRIGYDLSLEGPQQVADLLAMTPFFWSASPEVQARLAALDRLETRVDVVLQVYRRSP